MATGLGMSLRTSQSLALTPQLQQSIRMLQLSAQELTLEIQQLLVQNPCLTEDADDEDDLGDDIRASDEPDWSPDVRAGEAFEAVATPDSGDGAPDTDGVEGAFDAAEAPEADFGGDGSLSQDDWDANWADLPTGQSRTNDGDEPRDLREAKITLAEHLLEQIKHLRLSLLDRMACELVVLSLDEQGFLQESVEELAMTLLPSVTRLLSSVKATGEPAAETTDQLSGEGANSAQERAASAIEVGLRIVQQLDPVGLAVSGPVESLKVQAACRQRASVASGSSGASAQADAAQAWSHVVLLLTAPLAWIAMRDMPKLMHQTGLCAAEVTRALDLLRTLAPRPAAAFGSDAGAAVVPEVLVRRIGSRLKVELNPGVRHSLRIDTWMADRVRTQGRDSALSQKLQEARWFVKNLQQRYDTILRVSQVIVDRQRRFFLHGATEMRPLVLREVADELGVHESTVSRVTTAKYLQGPTGTFELKYFFASALDTVSGTSTSATAAKAMIKELISSENASTPLSDTDLSQALERRGVICARRTVAKYREALHIPVAQLRKAGAANET